MPESRKRRKNDYTPPRAKGEKKAVSFDSPRWLPVLMVGLWVIGLTWIVAWYMLPVSFIEDLGAWNVLIGFCFITGGFAVATRWR